MFTFIEVEIPVVDWVQKDTSKIVLYIMKLTASILLNILERDIHKLLLPGLNQKIMISLICY